MFRRAGLVFTKLGKTTVASRCMTTSVPTSLMSNSIVPITAVSNVMRSVTLDGLGALQEIFLGGILQLKRTFQPSLQRMKRKFGFLKKVRSKDGRKILNRRREKGRRRLSS